MEEGDVVAEKFVGVYHPLYDIPLHYGGLNVEEGDVATEVMDDFFGYVKDDNQDAMLSIEIEPIPIGNLPPDFDPSTCLNDELVSTVGKLLYNDPFSENELQSTKSVIQSNLFTYLGILLEGHAHFKEESLLENRKRRYADESTSSVHSKIRKITADLWKVFQTVQHRVMIFEMYDNKEKSRYRILEPDQKLVGIYVI
ncbi:hypothetical protein JHK87_006721 [Glycine soja]|nr:hypothetical protein JHK87_006721 [Glycine soja]